MALIVGMDTMEANAHGLTVAVPLIHDDEDE